MRQDSLGRLVKIFFPNAVNALIGSFILYRMF